MELLFISYCLLGKQEALFRVPTLHVRQNYLLLQLLTVFVSYLETAYTFRTDIISVVLVNGYKKRATTPIESTSTIYLHAM